MRKVISAFALLAVFALTLTQLAAKHGELEPLVIGKPVPDFKLEDQAGKPVSLADYKGKVVVLEWFNEGCPFVQKHYTTGHMNAIATKYAADEVVWLAINSTKSSTNGSNLKAAAAWKIDRPILNDNDGKVAKAYRSKNTPTMYVINKDQTLAYHGAIDSVASTESADIDGATNYVAKALDEIKAGKPVSQPETTAYGCGVKYAE